MTGGKLGSSKKKLVVFDLDGTLVELPIEYAPLKRKLEEKIGVSFETVFPALRRLGPEGEEKKRKAFEIIDRYELAAAENVRIREGAMKALQDSTAMGYETSIVTMQGAKTSEKVLRTLGIQSQVGMVVTREDSVFREEQISLVLERFGVSADHTVVIGDRIDDYESASRLGCKAFLVKRIGEIPYCSLDELKTKLL